MRRTRKRQHEEDKEEAEQTPYGVAECVCFLHSVSRQDYCPPRLGALNELPHTTSIHRVHAGRWLVEIENLWVGDE